MISHPVLGDPNSVTTFSCQGFTDRFIIRSLLRGLYYMDTCLTVQRLQPTVPCTSVYGVPLVFSTHKEYLLLDS